MSTQTITVEFKPQYPKAQKILPLALMLFVVLADQITKYFVVRHIPQGTIGFECFGGFLRIVHVSNPGIAFSIGQEWSLAVRSVLFRAVPIAGLAAVLFVYFKADGFTPLQRWALCGICGGGFGNLIDRFFRSEGVIDFIDVKFYGLFGLERWPTFNVADSAVVVCGILLFVAFLVSSKADSEEKK